MPAEIITVLTVLAVLTISIKCQKKIIYIKI